MSLSTAIADTTLSSQPHSTILLAFVQLAGLVFRRSLQVRLGRTQTFQQRRFGDCCCKIFTGQIPPCHPTNSVKALNELESHWINAHKLLKLNSSMKEPNISIYFFFPPITQWCYISDVLFTGGRGVSDFSVLKYQQLNVNYSVNELSKFLRILIDCSHLQNL